MSTATTVSRTPSAWCLGTVSIRPAVIICLATVFAQFALNALIAGFFYVTRGRSSENIYMAALNSALVMGIFLIVAGINQTISYMRAGSLSGAPRRTLALSSYVISAVLIALGSVIWWVLILIQPYLTFMTTSTITTGVDTWLIIVAVWIACDAAARLGSNVFRHRRRGMGSRDRGCRGRRYRRRPVRLADPDPHGQGWSRRSHAPVLLAHGNHPPCRRDRQLAPDPHGQDPPPQLTVSCALGA